MLAEIYCNKFYNKKIEFGKTLNVVLGTNTGDNSIGKSTFMLIVDYVFGGTEYAEATDILNNVGKHDLHFKFIFQGENYYFCRDNFDVRTVWVCDEKRNREKPISLKEYCIWLSKQYNVDLPDLSFREAVGRYIRAYGKGNCDEKHPLHYVAKESSNTAIVALLKLFDCYATISEIETQANLSREMFNAYSRVQNLNLVSKIGKRQYNDNIVNIKRLRSEIDEMSSKLEYGLLDVDAITSEKAVQLKSELSRVRKLRSYTYSKLAAINENGNYKFSDTSKDYLALAKYFPNIDMKHIEDIELFHEKVSSIFKQELNVERKKLVHMLQEYDSVINDYEIQLKELIGNPQLTKIVLQKHAEALKSIEKMQKDNDSYEMSEELKAQKKEDAERLSTIKNEQLAIIESRINTEMERINKQLYKEAYNSPLIHFSNSGYTFMTPDDTGTGIAYKGLVVFDLAILNLTRLPVVVHDSVVLKQISDDAIENIMNQYIASGKQTIIALDKQRSYSENTFELLEKHSILKLSPNGQELFGRSWGKR